ncbi:TonB C-terminal domain-containing protein [Hyalangium sp.]|uniref:TonB C-terminal domain-containing protein n=1 Tax=Hyalangium sp. TaxID=2028555 RepID=UPI002D44A8BF|nr:TonB C-terminal domain-containing protein [Hyalangium sp.]HYI00703.1 TonB C-terminal domain-containing protein [Hyalangium sp.]
MRRSRLGWAGLLSVLLHAAILALLWEHEPVRPVSAPPEPPPLVVEVISEPPKPPKPPAPTPASPPAPQPPARPPEPTPKPAPDSAPAIAPEPAAARAPDRDPEPGSASPEAPAPTPLPEDTPLAEETRRPSLLPPTPEGGWSVPGTAEAPRGRTLLPGDPSLSPEVLKAEERARVSARVQAFAEDDLATLRVENGLVHPYFSELRASLEKQMEHPPMFDVKSTGKRLAENYLKQAESYGATGTTHKNPGPIGREPPTALERLEALSKGNPAHDSMRAFLQAGEAMQQLAEPSPDLVIVLELQQAPDGQLRSVQVVERSANKAFDKYVLEAVPPALAKLTPPPEQALGVHPEGIRTLWAVEGRVVYLRKLSELEGQDAWYVASAAGLGVLSGRFDETTGDVYVIDIRNPKFVCRSRLLRVW